jgi:hypothetical protein
MNSVKITAFATFGFIVIFLFSETANAFDLKALQAECAELGLKIGTPANGKCVLKLRKKEKESEARDNATQEEQLLMYRLQQQREAELHDLQRRSVQAQEELAKAQDRAATNNMLFNGIQMMRGTGPYALPQPRAPITCSTFGSMTTCN